MIRDMKREFWVETWIKQGREAIEDQAEALLVEAVVSAGSLSQAQI